MGVRLYSPVLGCFLHTDPVKGGSADNYDCTSQDPINAGIGGTWKLEWPGALLASGGERVATFTPGAPPGWPGSAPMSRRTSGPWGSYFIDLRRRYIGDRMWYGMGGVAIGSTAFSESGVLQVLLFVVLIGGSGAMASRMVNAIRGRDGVARSSGRERDLRDGGGSTGNVGRGSRSTSGLRRRLRWPALAALAASLFLAGGAGRTALSDWQTHRTLVRSGQHLSGRVIEVLDRSRTGETLDVRVQLPSGIQSNVDVSDSRFFGAELGSTVEVVVDPAAPKTAVASDTLARRSSALAPLLVGVSLALLSSLILLLGLRQGSPGPVLPQRRGDPDQGTYDL